MPTEIVPIAEVLHAAARVLTRQTASTEAPERALARERIAEHVVMQIDRVRAVADRVAELGGVVRPSRLVREGHGRRHVSEAVSRGLVTRVRRDWIASPDVDEFLVAAAKTGTVVSCVTTAERLGLWVHERPAQPHVAHPGRGKIAATTAVVHWQRAIVPRHPDLLEDGVENVLMTVAACRPYEQARAVWESALNKGLVDKRRLERLPWVGVARRLAQEVTPWADSGLKTSFVTPQLAPPADPDADLDRGSPCGLPHRGTPRGADRRRSSCRPATIGGHPARCRAHAARVPRDPRELRAGDAPLARGAGADHAGGGPGPASRLSRAAERGVVGVREVSDAHEVSGRGRMPTEAAHIAEVVRAQTP